MEAGDVKGVFEHAIKPKLHEFASLAFESVCREYVREMQKAERLPFRYRRMGRWWGKTTIRRDKKTEVQETEIDLLAISDDASKYLVGECKFKGKPFDYGEYLNTTAKFQPQKSNAEIYYYLFSESGFAKNLIAESKKNKNLTLVNLDDLV